MTLIPLPSGLDMDPPSWRPVPTVQVNKSQWTNSRRVLDLDNGYYAASCAIFASTENDVRKVRAFHAALRGASNTFRLPATGCAQVASDLEANGAAVAGVNQLPVTGAAALALKAGMFATIIFDTDVEQLVLLTADTTISGGGTGTIYFEPAARFAIDDNADILVANPRAVVSLVPGTDDPVERDGVLTWAFDVEEAFDTETA